ncbi:hypothetical protein ACFE04_030254 [Oxalis oulophora]
MALIQENWELKSVSSLQNSQRSSRGQGKAEDCKDSKSKSDRKFEKKVEFYNKIKEHVTSLAVEKSIKKKKKLRPNQKKLKAYNLSSLSEFLPEIKEPEPRAPAEFKLSSKSRHKLMLKEGDRMTAVLNHSVFQSDPLAAIHQHLQNTQPVVDEKPKKRNKNGSKKSKKKKSKGAAPQSMDM